MRNALEPDRLRAWRFSRWAVWSVGAVVVVLAVAAAILLAADSSHSTTTGHPFLPDLSLDGSGTPAGEISKACGVAVDSEGDVYVSSSSSSAIDIFAANGDYLSTISNSNEPCGLGVDSKGNVYVSESARGNVVKYTPDTYPFDGAPGYGAPTTIDSSGKATGIAVDPFDDSLYVAKGDRIDAYDSDGALGHNEVQRVGLLSSTGGTFRLSFEGEKTGPIPLGATPTEIETALADLSTIGLGNISVKAGDNDRNYFIIFTDALGRTDVGPLVGDESGLSGDAFKDILVETVSKGFNGHIGKGLLAETTGVGAYTYGGSTHYVFAGDSAGAADDRVYVFAGNSIRSLSRRATIDGLDAPRKGFGFGLAGAYLGVDQENGHVYVHDAAHSVVAEFEATGPYVSQIDHESLKGQPAGIAVGRSDGPDDGTVYVASDASSDAEVLAFGPQPAPRRFPPPNLSKTLGETSPGRLRGAQALLYGHCGTAVDSYGNIYVSAGTTIKVYDPDGRELTKILNPSRPCDLAVDSEGDLYATILGNLDDENDNEVAMYDPDSYPPTSTTKYGDPKTIFPYVGWQRWIAVNPSNDHLLVNFNLYVASREFRLAEYDSARNGSKLISSDEIAKGVLRGSEGFSGGLAVCGKNGSIYVAGSGEGGWRIYVLNSMGTKRLTAIDGSGSPRGAFIDHSTNIAVDQSNCHVFIADYERPVEEYEASGAFVSEFGPEFQLGDVAVDSGPSSPNQGNVYVAPLDDNLLAFGPLSYDEP